MGARVFLYLIAILAVLAVPAFALENPAASVAVSVTSEKDAIYPGDCNRYSANVTNLRTQQRIDFSVEGEFLSWVSLTSAFADFNMTESKEILYYLCPPLGTIFGTYNFAFKATARADNTSAEKIVPVYILERPYLEIRNVVFSKDVYKIGEPAEVTVNIKNLGASDAKNIRLLLEIDGAAAPEKIRDEIPLIEAVRGSSITEKIQFDRYLAHGQYRVTAKIVDDIGDVLAEKSATMQIEEKSDFQTETSEENGILSKSITISAVNNGNKEGSIMLEDSGTGYLLLYSFERQPDKIAFEGSKKVFQWECELAPAKSCTVRYRVDYWLIVVAAAAVLGIAYVLYNVSQQPHIHKRIVKKDKEHAVHIVIKNRSRHTLQNIQVIDNVPEVVSIVAGSLSPSVKPAIKGKRGGTELTWTFAKLAPGEERVVSYKIRPVVMVLGKIHLPNARIVAVDAGGKKYEAKTSVVVE